MGTLRQIVNEPCVSDFDLEAGLWGDLTRRAQQTLRRLLEASMETEITLQLGYTPYQRDPQLHTDYRNGYYRRDLDTRFGAIRGLRVPRSRRGQTTYRVLERYQRRSPWVNQLVQGMFLAGVSTRRVGAIMESLLEASVSASTVSRVCSGLREQMRAWHGRSLEDDYRYLVLDGVTLRVKGAQGVVKRLALCVYGITSQGRREIVGYRLAKSESEAEWVALLEDLRRRGLTGEGTVLAVTDGGQGVLNALRFVYPRVPLQRCWAHKLRNVANCLKVAHREPCLKDAAGIYQASSRRAAVQWFRRWKANFRDGCPEGGGLPGEGSGSAVGLLLASQGALEEDSHHQHDRAPVPGGAPADQPHDQLPQRGQRRPHPLRHYSICQPAVEPIPSQGVYTEFLTLPRSDRCPSVGPRWQSQRFGGRRLARIHSRAMVEWLVGRWLVLTSR